MKSFTKVTLVLMATVLFTSCAKIFYSSDAYDLAQSQKTFAIIQPTVSDTGTDKKK